MIGLSPPHPDSFLFTSKLSGCLPANRQVSYFVSLCWALFCLYSSGRVVIGKVNSSCCFTYLANKSHSEDHTPVILFFSFIEDQLMFDEAKAKFIFFVCFVFSHDAMTFTYLPLSSV